MKAAQSITVSIGGKNFKIVFEDKESNRLMILSRHAEGSFHHMEGVLEVGHGCKVEVAVELYIGFCFEAFDQHMCQLPVTGRLFFFGTKAGELHL